MTDDFESVLESYPVHLSNFEGPLDLLLHLIRRNELNIYDIPMALVTEQYLAYLDLMRELDLDVAGEFLVMAATLIHIKSRLLLPRPDPTQDEVLLPTESADWQAALVIDNGEVGIWTVESFPFLPQYGCPEVVGCDDRGRCLDAGCDSYVPKPVEMNRLVEEIQRCCQGSPGSGAAQPALPS